MSRPSESSPATVDAPCPACGGDEHRAAYEVPAEPPAPPGPWRYVRCSGCQSFYQRPRVARPAELYGAAYHVHDPSPTAARVGRWMAELRARRLGRRLPPESRVFELGCGRGDLLAALRDLGFATAGIEPGEAAADTARRRGLDVTCADFQAGVGEGKAWDLVLAAHVIEHVAEPTALLAEIDRLLRPGGCAVIRTPLAGSWDGAVFGAYSGSFDVPYHLWVPSREALRRVVAEAGLVWQELAPDPVPNDWVHGLRELLRRRFGLHLRFLRPSNPIASLPLLPVSLCSALVGAVGRGQLTVRVGHDESLQPVIESFAY